MASILSILAILAGGGAVGVVLSAAPRVKQTTLWTAWVWALVFGLMGLAVGTFDLVLAAVPRAWTELLWYFTAIIGLCPAIAVLGARRPTHRVWNLFVIVPLLAVLGWPATTVMLEGLDPRVLRLEAPSLLAFSLVLVMGYGNYVGTRYGWCVVLAAAGELLLLSSLAGETSPAPAAATALRSLGLICLSAGATLARVLSSRQRLTRSGLDRVWRDFRNSFGIVWARRIMDRFNQQSQQEAWPILLRTGGFVTQSDSPNQQDDAAQSELFLRWLLRRFVDEEWLDSRIGTPDLRHQQPDDPTP